MSTVLYLNGPGGNLLYEEQGSGGRTHQLDVRGSTLSLVDDNGSQTDEYSYSWFGEVLQSSGPFETHRMWLSNQFWTDGSNTLPVKWGGAIGNWDPALGEAYGYPPRPTYDFGEIIQIIIEIGSQVDLGNLLDVIGRGWSDLVSGPPEYGITPPPAIAPPSPIRPPAFVRPPVPSQGETPKVNPGAIDPTEPKPCISFLQDEPSNPEELKEEFEKVRDCLIKSCSQAADLQECLFKCIFKRYSKKYAAYNCCMAASYAGYKAPPQESTKPGWYPCKEFAPGYDFASCCYFHFCACALVSKIKLRGPKPTLPTDFYFNCTLEAWNGEGCNESYLGPAICGTDPDLISG